MDLDNLEKKITEKTKDEYSYYASRSREKKMHKSIEEVKTALKNKTAYEKQSKLK